MSFTFEHDYIFCFFYISSIICCAFITYLSLIRFLSSSYSIKKFQTLKRKPKAVANASYEPDFQFAGVSI